MKNGDMRAACLALIKSRLGGLGRSTQPAALGWKLVNGDVPAAELAALCAAWMSDSHGADDLVLQPRWQPSPLLRVFFAEYRKIQAASPVAPATNGTPAPRPRRQAPERRTADLNTH